LTHSTAFRLILTYLDTFGLIWASSGFFQLIPTHFDSFWRI